ncbi:MAG: hypothetical protein IPN70_04025 [Candidatus Moraniibacteriota bacterium]|nr:MAG: hypothetical protein IPN70_04025 [Candidatus Moranbacteria bacterium]
MKSSLSSFHKKSSESQFLFGVREILRDFPERTQSVLSDRYNLSGKLKKGKTLEAIGCEYGVTRERVRQIIQYAMKVSRDRGMKSLDSAIETVSTTLSERGGILSKKGLLHNLDIKVPGDDGALDFILDLSDKFVVLSPNRYVTHAVSMIGFDHKRFQKVIEDVESFLQDIKKPSSLEFLHKILCERSDEQADILHLESFLISSATIDKNPLGEWGMLKWGEIRPKSAGQRAYLALRFHGKPMHFTQISQKIHELGLSSRKVNSQTVHNELIKSSLFVLCGRGIYGLSEWKNFS